MKPYYETKFGKLYHGDSREVVFNLSKPDLVFTSPPYANQRDYEYPIDSWTDLMSDTILSIPTKTKTQIIINLGIVYKNYKLNLYMSDFIDFMDCNEWRLYGLYIWDQMEGLPGKFHGRFLKSYELLFHFNKEWIEINKTKPCKTAGREHKPGSDGLLLKNGDRQRVRKFNVTGKYKKPRDVVRVPRDKGHRTKHPAIFPVALPMEFISAMTKRNQTVLDPFMGAGTTAIACEKLSRKWLGVEISEKYCEIAAKRIEKAIESGKKQ